MSIILDNTTNNNKLLTVLFRNPSDASKAYNYLVFKKFNKDNISIIMSEETRDKNFKDMDIPEDALSSKAKEGMGIGGAIGVAIGAIAAAVAAVGTTLVLPGLGIVIAGPIAAAFAGAGAGSVVGGMVGALVGSGMTDEQAKQYEEDIKSGGVLIGVEVPTEKYNEIKEKLDQINSYAQ